MAKLPGIWKLLAGLAVAALLVGSTSLALGQEQTDQWPDEYQLAKAIWDHDLEAARELIDQGIDVNYRDTNNSHSSLPISIAIMEEHLPMIELLLEAGASCSSQSSWGEVWYWVAGSRNEEILNLILDKAKDLNQIGAKDQSALATALKADWPYMLKALLEKNVSYAHNTSIHLEDANSGGRPFNLNAINNWGYTPLLIACRDEASPEIIEMLTAGGADVNFPEPTILNPDGLLFLKYDELNLRRCYPLHFAARFADERVYNALIEAGADMESTDWQGSTPLFAAANYDNENGVRVLLAAGADPNNCKTLDVYPIHYAAQRGNFENVKQLMEGGAEVNCLNTLNWSPLYYACKGCNSVEVVEYLIERGANPLIADEDGLTPLQMLVNHPIRNGHTCYGGRENCSLHTFVENLERIIEILQQYE